MQWKQIFIANIQKQPSRGVPRKRCSENIIKFTGENPCRSVISIIIEIALRHGCSPVNLLHIFKTPFSRNTSGRLLLNLTLTCKHVLNKSNAKISTHDWIICLYSKYVCCIFITKKTSNLFRNLFNTNTVKINRMIIKHIKSNPMSANISILIKMYYICPTFYFIRQIFTWINAIKLGFILIIALFFKVRQRMRQY